MNFLKNLRTYCASKKQLFILLNILSFCLIFYLIYASSSLWQTILHYIILIAKPLLIAFVIAYVFAPLVEKIEKKGIPRIISITIVVSLILFAFCILVISLIPTLYNKALELAGPLLGGLSEIESLLMEHFNIDISIIVDQASTSLTHWFTNLSFMNTTFDLITTILSKIGDFIIYLILSIYLLADYAHIRHMIGVFSRKIHPNFAHCLLKIDEQLIIYIQTFILLMCVQTVIYGGLYLLVGHSNWLLLGLLSGVSCLFPYIGPISCNILGIITALGMPMWRILLLVVLIFIQSNIDSYLITPKIYSSTIKIQPFFIIFGIITGSTLLGPWGVVIAMPMIVITKITLQTIKDLDVTKK